MLHGRKLKVRWARGRSEEEGEKFKLRTWIIFNCAPGDLLLELSQKLWCCPRLGDDSKEGGGGSIMQQHTQEGEGATCIERYDHLLYA